MSRTIHVTGGYADYAVGVLDEKYDRDLSTSTYAVMLQPVAATGHPTVDDPAWRDADVVEFPSVGTAKVSMLVTAANTQPGKYWLWIKVVDSPTVQPLRASNTVVQVV